MRKYLLFLALCFSFAMLNAQTVVWSDDFNDEDISDWTLFDEDGDGFEWAAVQLTDDFGDPVGTPILTSVSWSGIPLTPDNWAISPAIDLSAVSGDVTLKWSVFASDPLWNLENYGVYVATSNTVTAMTTAGELFTEDDLPSELEERTLDLSAFAGETIYVGFRHYDVTDQFRIGIDDVSVEAGEDGGPTEGNCDLEGTTVGGPVWDRPLATGTGMSSVGIGVTYHVYGPFTVDTAGDYDFSSAQDGWDGLIFVYQNAFDPADPLTNYLAGNDDGDGGIGTSDLTTTLAVGVEYFLITTGFDSADSGEFVNTITGPGTVSCGEIVEPTEGCLEAENGQYPTATFVPSCLGTAEDITTLAWTGEYSMVSVMSGTEYTFSVSDASYFITIGDAAGATVLASGTGSVTWEADFSGDVRFYTHFDSDCNFDSSTFLARTVLCGEPIMVEEPDFPCFQGDGLASNGPEDGLNISPNTTFRNADDFIVDETFTVQQVRLNILSLSEIAEVTLNFREDNAGSPGDVIETETMAPSAQRIVGGAFGFNAYEVTFDLPTSFEFGPGTYWLQPEAVNQDPTDGSIYWEATSIGSTGDISQTSEDSGASWMANEFGYNLVFFVAGECGEVQEEDCEQSTPSNAFENGHGFLQSAHIAHDFAVEPQSTFTVEQLTLNILTLTTTSDVSISFFEDAGGMPGALVNEYLGIVPTSITNIGTAFGFNVESTVVDLPEGVEFTGGATGANYFVAVTINNSGNSYWESTSVMNTDYEGYFSSDGGVTWSALSNGPWDGVFTIAGTCGELGVSEMESFDFAYYPNPVKDELNISSQKPVQSVSVYNLAGQQVSTQKLNVTNGTVSTSALAPGVYVFRAVLEGGQVETFKIIKK